MGKRCETSQEYLVLHVNFPVCFSEIPPGAHQGLWAGWLLRDSPGTLRWVPSTQFVMCLLRHTLASAGICGSPPQGAPADTELLILSSGMRLSQFALGSIAPAQPSLCFVGSECWGSFWVCYSSSLRHHLQLLLLVHQNQANFSELELTLNIIWKKFYEAIIYAALPVCPFSQMS